ncbi:MAG TPA: zinc ABC transporter substrate-binding protein [Lachnospiraceae bacterium]|nr:zinc ABC transporter substrate-binding protein [Lachnospiraceae bacterium]
MKRVLSTILSTAIMIGCLSACGTTTPQNTEPTSQTASAQNSTDDKMQIVTTIFPEYDWVKQILGDKAENADLTLLLDNGIDLHSYQPTAEDILKISSCDMFVYIGGESDEWVEDTLEKAQNKDMKVINLMEIMGESAKEEEIKEGMEAEHEHDHEDGDEHDEKHEEHEDEHDESEYDEHVWLSVKNAEKFCNVITDDLCQIDPDNSETYKTNLDAYTQQLTAIDDNYTKLTADAENKTLIFGDRFPFRYFVDDYGLDYYAAFVGCSAETEASFETVMFLAGKVNELSLNTILTIENNDQKIAKTIADNTEAKNQQILTMDSMQSTTAKDVEAGASYVSIMESNLEVLKEALK